MDTSTTVSKTLTGNKLFVPSYQRAYSWETESDQTKTPKQTDTFLSDLEDYMRSLVTSPYYFGHFLFEQKSPETFGVIDGQQRLTTIVIFISAIFARLKLLRNLTEEEKTIHRSLVGRFETVDYDNQLFKDYVITEKIKEKNSLKTESAKRIVKAYDFFKDRLSEKDESHLLSMLQIVQNSSCTTHAVQDESEAIQMFIFQNSRGKKPTNLEIIKALFMFNVHLYGGDEKENLIEEIKNRFGEIYKSISAIEYRIDEDDVLLYTARVHFNSLYESNVLQRIEKILSQGNPISFIQSFTLSLAVSFDCLNRFFGKDEREKIEIHSLVVLGGISIALPFIIKAYRYNLSLEKVCELCLALESIVLRQRLIGTRADITSRLENDYKLFTEDRPDISPILERISFIKYCSRENYWWAFWNVDEFERSLQGVVNPSTAKFLLWKYENHLKAEGKKGYAPTRYTEIISPHLEHIAPQTPSNGEPIAAGYCEYDEEFIQQFINCLGNYLLLSQNHNCSIGNLPFSDKRATYNYLYQQREVQDLTSENAIWSKDIINNRKKKIVAFVLNHY